MSEAHFEINKLKEEINSLISDYSLDPYDDDEADVWSSALEGETSVEQVMERLLDLRYTAAGNEEAVKMRIADLRKRQDRYKLQQERLNKAMQQVMHICSISKLQFPFATFSLRQGSVSVFIEDENAVPKQLCSVKYSPDKKAIKAALEQGEIVPGAVLTTGNETISIKTK